MVSTSLSKAFRLSLVWALATFLLNRLMSRDAVDDDASMDLISSTSSRAYQVSIRFLVARSCMPSR